MSNHVIDEILQTQLKVAEKAFDASDDYHVLRPGYTFESVDYLLKEVGAIPRDGTVNSNGVPTVLELGCGTGLLTKTAIDVLKGANVRYIASDPTDTMGATFAKVLPDVEFLSCTAENIPLPDNSVRAILAAACYHWFANEQAYREMYRVLEPNGMLGYITNLPSETDSPQWMLDGYKLVHKAYAKTKVPFEHDWKWKDELEKSGYFHKIHSHLQFRHLQKLTKSQCVKHFLSYGGVITGSDQDKNEFVRQFHDILDNNFPNGGKPFEGINHVVEIYTSKSKKTF